MQKTATTWLLAFLCSGIALAQSTAGAGAIGGTVRDNNGEGLPDTDVMIQNQSMALQRSAQTSDSGVFQSPGLVAGSGYKLKIARKGFQEWESAEFTVPVGQTVNFDIRLQVEAAAGPGSGATISTSDSSKNGVASVFGAEEIAALPLMQRRIDELTPLAPTASTDPVSGQIAILGLPFANGFLTDGILTRDAYFAHRAQTDATPLDAIQGFQILEADAPTEFSHSMSGVVNAATRAGTNSYHGAAYGFLRLPGLTAVGRYSDGQTLLHDRNQSGVNAGGPILSGKLFFFANFEVLNNRYDGLNRITNQLIADPTASIVAPSNCKATAAACAAAERFIQSQMNVLVPLSQRSVDGIARIDYRLNMRNSINVAGNLNNSLAPDGLAVTSAASNGGLLGIRNTREDSRYAAAGVTTNLFTSATNELRLGESQQHIAEPSATSGLSTGGIGISVAGATVGDSNPNGSVLGERRFHVVDNFTAPLGDHTIQVGFEAVKSRFSLNSLASQPVFDFATLTAFATDLASTTGKDYSLLTQSLGVPTRRFPLGEYDFYAQDTWKLSSKLTVLFGFRWDEPSLPKPPQENTAFYLTGAIPTPKLDLMPRLGAAYQVNDKTAVRAGYGFYYVPFTGQLMDALYLGNALSQATLAISPSLTGAPAFPAGIPLSSALPSGSVTTALPVCNYGVCTVASSGGTIPSGAEQVIFANNKLPNSHTQQVSLAAERRLDSNTTVTLSLIDSRAVKLITATDANLGTPTQSIAYTLEDVNGNRTGSFVMPVYTALANATYSHAYQVANGGSSRYDAAVIEVRRQMSRGLMFQASYTLSHATDNISGLTIAGGIPAVEANTPAFTGNRASSPTDQRQRLIVNGTWQPEFSRSKSFLARYLINGWQVSPILMLASGHPVTATVAADQLAYSGVTPLFANTMDGSGGNRRVPFLAVDAYTTGTERSLDVRLARSIPITERVRGLLMFDLFNALNSQWTTGLNTVAYTASGGIVRAVPGAGAGAAAVSYPYGTNARSAQVGFRIVF
jgi:hypothetical protein